MPAECFGRDTVLLFSFLIGYGAHLLLSDDSNVIDQFPVDNTGIMLEVKMEHAHLFLAEYDFTFVLKKGSKVVDSVVVADTGGHSRIEVLKDTHGRTVLRHFGRNICLDKSTLKFDDFCDTQKEAVLIGYFDFDTTKHWRYLPDLN